MGQKIGGNHSTLNAHSSCNRIVQDVLLIWLDQTIDEENNRDCQKNIAQLRSIVPNLKTFTNADQCVHFISEIRDEKVCLITSGLLGEQTVPIVYAMSQVISIIIFCGDVARQKQWAKQWPKIYGIFNNISPVCEVLQEVVRQFKRDTIPTSILPANTVHTATNKKLDQLEASFMYTQILKEILLTIEFEDYHFNDFIEFCHQMHDQGHKIYNVSVFERKYREYTPIWWYTSDFFMYSMLNRALQQMNTDVIIRMGFFVNALHHELEQLHNDQFGGQQPRDSFTVFRGQGWPSATLKEIQEKTVTLISFNSFLSTSKNRNVSLNFARQALNLDKDLVGVLFVITVDPRRTTTPFASIIDVSSYGHKEDEVLFSMHTVFRIGAIKVIDGEARLYQLELKLTSDDDADLRALTDCIRQQIAGSTGWDRLGQLLLKVGEPKKAEEVYQILFKQTIDASQKGYICYQLGSAKYHQGKYREAIEWYEEALRIQQRSLSPNQSDLAKTYSMIGNAYSVIGRYSEAFSSHKNALKIQQKSLPPNHLDLALSYDSIGSISYYMGEYSKALPFQEQALQIRQQSLPHNHPELAMSYHNTGMVHEALGRYSTALLFYERAVVVGQCSLLPNHPHLQMYTKKLNAIKELL